MIRKSIFLFLICALVQNGLAQTADMVEKVLPSGLRIVTMANPGSQTVSVNIFVAAGSIDETSETAGLAHFYEHMFFRGTTKLSGLAYKKAIEDRGGVTNATTARDMTHYFISLPASEAERGLELLADALLRPELSQKEVDIERDVVLEEYRIGENNPGRQAMDELYRLAYDRHPYSQSPIGTQERIKSFNRADFLRWREQHYLPSRCTVVVVGDIDPSRLAHRAETLFANFKSDHAVKRHLPAPPAIPEEPVYGGGTGPIGGALVTLGFPAPAAAQTNDVHAVDVLIFLLGQGPHSRLHKKLVKSDELATSVSVDYLTPRQRGLIVVSALGETKKATQIRKAILTEIEAVRNGEFSDDELKRAKAELLQSFLQQNETNAGKADTIGFYSTLGVPDMWKTYPDDISRISRDDLIKAATKYLGDGHWGYTLRPGGKGR